MLLCQMLAGCLQSWKPWAAPPLAFMCAFYTWRWRWSLCVAFLSCSRLLGPSPSWGEVPQPICSAQVYTGESRSPGGQEGYCPLRLISSLLCFLRLSQRSGSTKVSPYLPCCPGLALGPGSCLHGNQWVCQPHCPTPSWPCLQAAISMTTVTGISAPGWPPVTLEWLSSRLVLELGLSRGWVAPSLWCGYPYIYL